MRPLKLTPKLTLVFALFAGLLLLGLTIPAYLSGRSSLRAASYSELLSTALEKEAALNYWVNDRSQSLGNIATQFALQETLTKWMTAESGSVLADAYYNELIVNLKNWSGGPEHRYDNLDIINAETGQVMISTNKGEEGKYKESQPYFINGKLGVYVQNPYYDLALGRPTMTAAAPLYSTNGDLLAVLAGNLNFQELDDIIQRRSGLHISDDSFLVNSSNLFITQPRLLPDAAVLQRGIHTEAVDLCLQRNSGVIEANDYRGIAAIIVYRWLSERQMCLITKIDQQEAFAPVRTLGATMGLIGGLVFLLGCLAAFFLSRNIARPVKQLLLATQEVGQGNLNFRTDIQSKDELGALGSGFNRMAAALMENDRKLRNWTTELENSVADRTRELAQSENRYRILAETSPDMIFVIDKEDTVQYVNQLSASQFGKKAEQVTGKNRSELFPPAVAEQQKYGLQKVLATGQPLSSESSTPFPGGVLWLDTQLVPIMDETGSPIAVMGVSRDISERKRFEQFIQEEKALSDSIINSLPGIFYMFDSQGEFLRWNKNFELVSGFTAEDLPARNPLDFFNEQEKPLVQKRIEEAFDKGQAIVEANFTSKTGKSTPFLLTGIRVEVKNKPYIIGTGIDISNRKQAEEKLHQKNIYLSALQETSVELLAQLNTDVLLENIVKRAGQLLNTSSGFLDLIEPENGRLMPRIGLGALSESLQNPVQPGEGIAGTVWQTGQTLIINDYDHWQGRINQYSQNLLSAVIGVPLIIQDKVIGVLGLGYEYGSGKSFSAEAEEVLTLFARLASLTIENARLYTAAQQELYERIQSEQALFESRRQLATLMSNLPGMAYRCNNDPLWTMEFISDASLPLTGYRPEELVDNSVKPYADIIHPQDRRMIWDLIQERLKQNLPYQLNYRILTASGEEKWVREQGQGISDEQGNVVALEGLITDITDRIIAEQALKETTDYLENLINYANAPIIVWDSKMRIMRFNHAFEKLTGFSAVDVIGKKLDFLFPHGNKKNSIETIKKSFDGTQMDSVEIPITSVDGKIHTVLWNSANLYSDDDQTLISTIAQGQDISDRILAEKSLLKANEELIRSNSELERFAYVASHDLQEPLRMITSYLQLLEKRYSERLDGDALEFIEYAVDGALRMKTLINDLLAYSRVGTRGKEFEKADLNIILDQVLTTLGPRIQQENALITFDPLPELVVDEGQIQNLFQNLVTNAIKFHGEESPKIHISAKKEETHWLFSIKDNGIGIDEQYFDRVFIIFQRLHNRDEYEGTGIGLAISKRIVDRHGGRIWIESQPGKGTVFYFTLPIKGAIK